MISKQSRLSIASILLLNGMQLCADTPITVDSLVENAEQTKLIEQAKRNLKNLDFALEELAQAVHTDAAKAPDKKNAREEIRKIRTIIAQHINPAASADEVPVTLPTLVELDKILIRRASELTTKNFKDLSDFDATQALTSLRNLPTLDTKKAESSIESHGETIKVLRGYIKETGLTPVNRAVRNLEQFDTNWNITTVLKRLLPYAILGSYCIAVTGEDDLPNWKWLRAYKDILGIIPRIGEKWRARNNANAKENGKDKASGTTTSHPDQDPRQATTFPQATELVKEPDITPGKGLIGKPLSKGYSVLTFGKEGTGVFHLSNQPVVTFTLAALFGDQVKRDIKDLWGWGSKQTRKAFSALKGESFNDSSVPKDAKIAFKDIIGQEHAKAQLTKIVNYFKDQESLDRSGALVSRGYILVGALDSAKMLAQATAKEISEQLKAQQKNRKCKIHEIHASDFITKDFGDILKKVEENAPSILLINELDWLCAQDKILAEKWSGIIKAINSIATSRKEVFVIATAQNRCFIDKALTNAERFGIVVTVEMPAFEDRKGFIEKELQDRCISRSLFDVDHIAYETDKCTYTQLSCLIKRALALAYTQEETLKPQHIEQSINELVHGIKMYEPTPQEKQKLAAYYAGRTLAHKLSLPNRKLIKVTILPVDTQAGTNYGKLITYMEPGQEALATESDIKDTCMVELAGIEAQRILLQSPVQATISLTLQKVSADLKKIIFEGINEKDLPKEQREKKKALIEESIKALQSKARMLLESNKDKLERLARILEDKLILTAQEIDDILA